MRKIFVFTAVMLTVAVLSFAVWAGVGLSPLITELIMPPGSSHEGVVRITNTGDEAIVVKSSVCGFIAPDGVAVLLDPEHHEEDLYAYCGKELLTVDPSEQTIQAGETFAFRYRISMPEELEPYGGRYVAAVFQVVPPDSDSQVLVATQVASLFLINPGGDVAPHFSLEILEIHQDGTDPRKIYIRVQGENLGNIHLSRDQVFGIVHVVDEDGYIIDQFEAFAHTMLPGEENTHVHHEIWVAPDTLPSGTYFFHVLVIDFSPSDGEAMHYNFLRLVDLKF